MTEFWDKNRNIIRSRTGGWVRGKGVYSHGYSLMDEIVGKSSYFQLLILNITGKLPDKRFADWLEAEYACMSYPDARIWCNQISALAGTSRATPFAALTAGVLASDSSMYGPGTVKSMYEFLNQASNARMGGSTIEEILVKRSRRKGSKPIIPGYGRPLATGDERVAVMEKVAKDLGFETGEVLQLAYNVERYLLEHYDESMNFAAYTVAFMMDQKLNLLQIQSCLSFMVVAGTAACFIEAREYPPESFLPLRCDDIKYTGPEKRPVPDSN